MKGNVLGELEELVLLTIAVLDQEAYGVAVTQEIEQQTGRVVDFSSVHTTLKRLQEKGLLRSEMGGATTAGFQALREVQQTRSRLWEQIPNKMQWEAI
jgi:PadR family transcriptional regulator, regulatory protein PadR